MKRIVLFLFFISALFSCTTVTETFTTSVSEEEISRLEDIELLLLEYQFSGDKDILKKAQAELDALKESTVFNKKYEAKIYGLYGEIAFYKNDLEKVEKYIEQIEMTYGAEERLYILKSLIETDTEKKIEILQMGMIEAETYTLVQLALAEIYFNTGDYKNAAALYDEAFLLLSDKYREYYRKNRDLAYEFMENPPASMEVSEIIAEEILNYKHLIFYILLDTNFFENITADRNIEPEELLNKLIERGYIHEKDTALGDTCMRKDISFLFLNILVYLTNNTGLLDKYRKSYLELNKPSPVPDVKTKDYFFDAVLVLVEREIMSLPDGINFFPEESMSGLELSEIVNQLKRMY